MALYLAAGTALNGITFTEVADANYARQLAVMSPVAQGYATVALPLTFPMTATVTTTVVAEAIFDAPTGGNMLVVWARAPAPLSPTIALAHALPLRLTFPGAYFPAGTNATLWMAGAMVGTFDANENNRGMWAGVTLALSNGVISHFVVV